VELHDSLSQCLGGLACQLAASKSLAASSPEKALSCLDAAERMLQSSRTELQRCIFDLRDDTLNDADFSRAIRRAVAPCSGEAAVDVRFVGGRSHIGDSAAHTILCIIRELVSNAARHGRAAKITVVGDNDGRTAAFSVRDDGCGFDVSAQSGPAGGHFGLEGIRERVKRQGGSFRIDSAPGRGTTAFVEINLKADSEETE
ncbi:MAG: hypothetical protein IJ829_00790, partial [Kiritimatiellae bacterium]|nr:hypothetical protein [Kiritimatiellia bacterium]